MISIMWSKRFHLLLGRSIKGKILKEKAKIEKIKELKKRSITEAKTRLKIGAV